MRVSIITPSYNQAGFLEETIQSVLSQDYPEIEYWILDGGSTDDSVDIIRKYESRLAGWVSEKDRGQGDAINKGLARATGEVVAWINSDDYYLPGAVRAAVEALQSHPEVGMVYGDVVSINAQGEPFNVMTCGPWGVEDLMQFRILGQPAVFMRRSVQIRAGLLDPSFDLVLDMHLFLKMAMQAPMLYVPRRWAAARYHAAAKNVAKAPYYGAEAYRLVAWMQAQPELAEPFRRARRKVWAGAHLYGARYLQDGGKPRAALASYLRSIAAYPPIGLREWRRILFALAGMVVNVDRLRENYLADRKRRFSGALGKKETGR